MLMNKTIRVIKSRRSIRKYRAEQIKESDLQGILECAIYAPSATNRQKWHFSVVQDPKMLQRMVEIIRKNIPVYGSEFIKKRLADNPDYNPFYNAPTVVLITAPENLPLSQIDCALAAQNMVLAAESLNLGSCIIASSGYLFATAEGRELGKELGVPEGYSHICAVLLGYKDENPAAPARNRDAFSYIR